MTQVLWEYHLYVKLKKCEYNCDTIHFLGYAINQHGICMDQKKIQAVENWPQPTSIKELYNTSWGLQTSTGCPTPSTSSRKASAPLLP